MFENEVSFISLQPKHFQHLQKWLNTPHVHQWWDSQISFWTVELIQEKYQSYTQGYKVHEGQKKKISAFIMYIRDRPIGYIQYYNQHDFDDNRFSIPLGYLETLAGLDLYIGEKQFIGHGYGEIVLGSGLIKLTP